MSDEGRDEGLDEGDFPASESTPGQAESRAARKQLDCWLKEQTARPAWFDLWNELREERGPMMGPDGEVLLNERGEARTRRRWDWRKALYIAWSSLPRSLRQPETLEKLADLLGLRNTGTIRNWRRTDPEIEERVAELPRRMLLGHVADVFQALVTVASSADPKAHPDRRLFLEMAGEYSPKGSLALSGPDGGAVPLDLRHGLGELAEDELDALDRIARRLAGDQGGEGAAAAD